jgi:hypothetical protein
MVQSLRRYERTAATHLWLELSLQDMFLAALYLWKLPDMDFAVSYSDSCMPDGWPVLGEKVHGAAPVLASFVKVKAGPCPCFLCYPSFAFFAEQC